MKLISIILLALSLAACANTEYAQYTASQTAIATAKSASDTARYQAPASIAKDGTDSARVADVMALALGGGQTQAAQVQAPQRSDALQWASILVPGLTPAWAISRSADVAINSSNNAAATSAATTAGFVGIAGKIQAPGAVDSHDTTFSGTGVIGTGSYTTNANPTDSHNVDSHAVDDHMVNPAPVVITPVTVTPGTKVCTVDAAGVMTCQ